MELLGNSVVLEFLLKRLEKSATIDEIIVATTESREDDQVVALSANDPIKVHRGSERMFYSDTQNAADESNADIIVRVTGDCPFVDSELVDDCVNRLIDHDLDYISNCTTLLIRYSMAWM